MLTENDVVSSLAKHLRAHGYRVDTELRTDERGIDIDAVHPRRRRRVLIEAKGATSSKRGTSRFGKPFSRGQCRTHLAVALLAAAVLREQHQDSQRTMVAIALPDMDPHRDLAAEIRHCLSDLRIGLFWVSTSGRVILDAPWRL